MPDIMEVRTEIELPDAKDAVVQLGKARGIFVQRHEIGGPDGEPLVVLQRKED